ncbi:polyketide cyclase [Aldersonia kunmingensis]|uniref:polyketide cyclase n=1 Tax=Aldersonia kunmingensis TaxID=408066 RepID=UPI00082CF0C3|nr:polyketide cyclase [Aldersonia kunmingensis]
MIGDRWGVTDAEMSRPYPCDEFVPNPVMAAWRGVTVYTTPDRVWRWIVQLRLAPYSYDWIDNLGRRSPRELQLLPDPVPGDAFTATGGRPQGRVLALDPGRHLTATIMGAVMSYVLIPDGADATRLVLKVAQPKWRLLGPFLCLGDLVMARRQLANLKQLAERT